MVDYDARSSSRPCSGTASPSEPLSAPSTGQPPRRGCARPDARVGFTYPLDRYGVSRRRAWQPALRLGTLPCAGRVARMPAMLERGGATARCSITRSSRAQCVERARARRGRLRLDGRRSGEAPAPRAAGVDGIVTNDPRIFRGMVLCRREARASPLPCSSVRGRGRARRGASSPRRPQRPRLAATTPATTTAPRRPRRRPPRRRATTTSRPATIAAGVTVGGVVRSGACPRRGHAAVTALLRPAAGRSASAVTLTATPRRSARRRTSPARSTARARRARRQHAVKVVRAGARVRAYAATLAKRFERTAVDSRARPAQLEAVRHEGLARPAPRPVGAVRDLFARLVRTSAFRSSCTLAVSRRGLAKGKSFGPVIVIRAARTGCSSTTG